MKTLALGLLIALSALAQKIEIESDQTVDFSRFRTFAIRDGRLNSKNPSLNSDLVRKRLDADIRKYLEAKGLAFVPSGPSDLNIRYTLGSVRKAEVEAYPAGWRGWGTRVVRVPYTEGTLVIDLRDPSTKSLVWRAIAREDKGDAAKVEGKLDDMVKKALEKYPPKAR
jgi:Domain of unknown function (DUF4136)